MAALSPFSEARAYTAREWVEYSGVRLGAAFGTPAEEYQAARQTAVLLDRSQRGLLVVTGSEIQQLLFDAADVAQAQHGTAADGASLCLYRTSGACRQRHYEAATVAA